MSNFSRIDRHGLIFILGKNIDDMYAYFYDGSVYKAKKTHIGIEWRYSHQVNKDKLGEVITSFNKTWELIDG
jgi:hypothetical protein